MFGFGNNKKKAEKAEKVELTEEEKSSLKQQANDLQSKIASADDNQKPDLYDGLGGIFQKLDDVDGAIDAFESSLKIKERYGAAYNSLLTLYDIKRKCAAENKDNDEIQKWINKTDDLLAMSKRVMRSTMV